MSVTNKPLKSFFVGPYSASLWGNTYDAPDGTQRIMKSITLRKSFQNKEKQMDHQSVSMNPAEIGSVIALLQEMQNAVIEERVTKNGDDQCPVDVRPDGVPF